MPRHSPHEALRANLSPFARYIEHETRTTTQRASNRLYFAPYSHRGIVAFLYPDKGVRPSPTTTKRGARMTRTPLVSRIVTDESPPGAPYIILFLRRFLST